MKRILIGMVMVIVMAISAHAQTTTFALTAQPVALPGGKQTVAGTLAGMALTITNKFDLRNDDIIAPGNNFQGYFGGFNYRLPIISHKLNNVSPTLPGERFQFYLTGSVGIDRITSPDKTVAIKSHYAVLAGGGVNYDLTGSGHWTFGAEIRWAKLPGLNNSTAIVSVGPALHW